jgi:hypothetical protein
MVRDARVNSARLEFGNIELVKEDARELHAPRVSASLWLPKVVHAVIDLRVLLIWRGNSRVDSTSKSDAIA